MERERREWYLKGKREKEGETREREDNGKERDNLQKEPKKGWPPRPASAIVHLVENRIPHRGFDVGAKVFVEALTRAAISSPDLQGFTDFEVIIQLALIFVRLVDDDCRGSPVDVFFTMLFVSTDARVAPVALVGCAAVLFTPCDDGTSGLSNVFGFVGAWAFYFINSRFFDGVMFGGVC